MTLPVAEPSRFVVAGDWHGSEFAARAAIGVAARAGAPVLVQVGDFGLWAGRDGERFLAAVSAAAVESGVHVLWLDGNHENFDLLDTFPVDPATRVRPVVPYVAHLPRGSRWTWGGLRFAAVGGATSLDVARRTPGCSWWPQEALTAAQAHRVAAEGPCDVLLTHDCPEGVAIPGVDRVSSRRWWPEDALRTAWAHREQLAVLVAELSPTHLFHGHFHVRYTAAARLCPAHVSEVVGLGDDSSGADNIVVVDVAALSSASAALRAAG